MNNEFYKYSKYVKEEEFHHSVHISLSQKFLYTATPKVACSTIKSTLYKLELESLELALGCIGDLHDRNLSPLLKPSQVGDFDSLVRNTDFLKFCFVRNPYTRLLSAYLNKICGNEPQKRKILIQLGFSAENINKSISFADFVSAVVAQPVEFMNAHWRTQYYHTIQNSIEYDFIGRFENLQSDLESALKRLNVRNLNNVIITERQHASNAEEKIALYYTEEIRDLVYSKYQKDFDAFNYSSVLSEVSNTPAKILVLPELLSAVKIKRINRKHHQLSPMGKKNLLLKKCANENAKLILEIERLRSK